VPDERDSSKKFLPFGGSSFMDLMNWID